MQSNTCCTHMQASDALFRPMRTTQGRVDVLGQALPLNVLRRYFEKVFLGQDQTYCTAEDIFFIGNQEFKCRRIGVGREALLRSGACRHIVQSCVCRHVCAAIDMCDSISEPNQFDNTCDHFRQGTCECMCAGTFPTFLENVSGPGGTLLIENDFRFKFVTFQVHAFQ